MHDETLRFCGREPIKKFDGLTGLLDLDFIFMFRVIDFRSREKDDDSEGTLIQSDGKTLSTCRMVFT